MDDRKRLLAEMVCARPIIRLQSITIRNFKNVCFGTITLFDETQPDLHKLKNNILGIYGQNGSGKTCLIEALSLLKYVLQGSRIPSIYAEYIPSNETDTKTNDAVSTFSYTFLLQYIDGGIRKIKYVFDLQVSDDCTNNNGYATAYRINVFSKRIIRIVNEKIYMAGVFEGKKHILKPILDTSSNNELFTPVSKQKYFFDTFSVSNLAYYKRYCLEESRSFIFYNKTKEVFKNNISEYSRVVLDIGDFATKLHVVDMKSSGIINLKEGMILYSDLFGGVLRINTNQPSAIQQENYEIIKRVFESINVLLEKIIPGLNIEAIGLSPTILENGEKGQIVDYVAHRNGISIPLRNESDGVRKIISILGLIIAVYNNESMVIAIDELDSGIYEYLLGELLHIIDEHGKGQLIFTSHNLRPLEVLKHDDICFTTTNPENRYIKIKYVRKNKNLRSQYFQEIIIGNNQDEELYEYTKEHVLIEAFKESDILLEQTKTDHLTEVAKQWLKGNYYMPSIDKAYYGDDNGENT